MKVLNIESNISKTYSSYRSELKIYVNEISLNAITKITELRDYIKEFPFNEELDGNFFISFIYVKNVIKISIEHKNETYEEISKIISEITNGNSTYMFLLNGLDNNYYKFLSEVFIKFLET